MAITVETPGSEHVELPITGMTCASCANRIERKLNKLDGVTASVNYATERATVDFDPAVVAPERLVEQVEAAGYRAVLPGTAPATSVDGPGEPDELRPLRHYYLGDAEAAARAAAAVANQGKA